MSASEFLDNLTINLPERQWFKESKCQVLLIYFLSSFTSSDTWLEEIFPYITAMKNGVEPIDDWGHFDASIIVIFRKDFVMICDDYMFGKENGEPHCILNEDGSVMYSRDSSRWLYDTKDIEQRFPNSYLKIPMNDFFEIGNEWVQYLQVNKR